MAIITDATLGKIAEKLEEKNAIINKFVNLYAPTTWLKIQTDIRAGNAKKHYVIGDELVCEYDYNGTKYDFPWIVCDIDREVEWEDGTKHPGMVLMSKYGTVESIQFDAQEQEEATEETALEGWYYCGRNANNYTLLNLETGATVPYSEYEHIYHNSINHLDVFRYGYNRWSMSGKRQWLNSAANAGAWWTAQHNGDSEPQQLNTCRGFMAGLDSDFLEVVTPIKIQTATNTVTDSGVIDTTIDKFWLPTVEEMYGVPQLPGVEGDFLPYWKTITGLDSPSNNANDGRKCFALENHSSTQTAHLRSSNRSNAYNVWYRSGGSGQLGNYYASNAYRCAVACVIS